ncbi:MAG: hypothetical protein K2L83_04975 [Muribaculaceae bacterium]|nr:hypothetical protein [Muribaculaceae bacterium]MDE6330050.1 hypothetical protein [Muribaculaceae bacterium]
MKEIPTGRWDATAYFRDLTAANKLTRELGFRFCEVSSLQGFEDAVRDITNASNFVCVSDTSDGVMSLHSTPHITQVKTVFLAMRHDIQSADRMANRAKCLDIEREIFRQFMSALAKERSMIEQGRIMIDPDIRFSEIDRYFISGCACAYFQISVTAWSDLIYRPEEWQTP